ncbi:MAG: BA14K family protein [Akkermansiaceae bacterium]|nr:BA14K family protein [Verrucomicrobiales bacterium]
MRMILTVLALGVFSAPAFADVKSYCEVFSQDFASAKTSDVDEWQASFRSALGDCMAQYATDGKAVPPPKKTAEKVSKKIVVVPATSTSRKKRMRILEPGSNAWVAACSAKYASFDSGTGNYKSRTGKQRRCSV